MSFFDLNSFKVYFGSTLDFRTFILRKGGLFEEGLSFEGIVCGLQSQGLCRLLLAALETEFGGRGRFRRMLVLEIEKIGELGSRLTVPEQLIRKGPQPEVHLRVAEIALTLQIGEAELISGRRLVEAYELVLRCRSQAAIASGNLAELVREYILKFGVIMADFNGRAVHLIRTRTQRIAVLHFFGQLLAQRYKLRFPERIRKGISILDVGAWPVERADMLSAQIAEGRVSRQYIRHDLAGFNFLDLISRAKCRILQVLWEAKWVSAEEFALDARVLRNGLEVTRRARFGGFIER